MGDTPDRSESRVPAGRVGRAHGLDGSFYVTGPQPRLLDHGATVAVGGVERTIERRAGTDAKPILRLQGVSDRAGAEALRGLELAVTVAAAPELGEDEFWAHELEGCEVRDGERLLGTVSRLVGLPSCEVLEVGVAGGGAPLLVPMVRDAIRRIDPVARVIEVDSEFLGVEDEG
jgi:16S rRNA processing protein RimM